MIEKMRKVMAVVRRGDQSALLTRLGELGVVHLTPVDPDRAVPDDDLQQALNNARRARQLIESVEAAGATPEVSAADAVDEIIRIDRGAAECESRLTSLYRQLSQQEFWGDVRREQLQALADAGLMVRFYQTPEWPTTGFEAEFVAPVGEHAGATIVAIAARADEITVPEDVQELAFPQRDNLSLKNEAQEIEIRLREDRERLAQLAGLRGAVAERLQELEAQAEHNVGLKSGLAAPDLFAVQGWAPARKADKLAEELVKSGLDVGVSFTDPDPDEQPPTLVTYPAWARPIKALFDILGTTPGYHEYDLAPFFMLAMPVFTAMLVGDGGYGLIFTLVGLLAYKKLKAAAGAPAPNLVIIFGLTTLLWGILTANFFGVGPEGAGPFASIMTTLGVLWRSDAEAARNVVMKISFSIGCIHLVAAHLRRLVAFFPSQLAVAELGWCLFIFAMFNLVWLMFFGPLIPTNLTVGLLVGGWVLIALFCHPVANPLKRIGIGVLSNLMSISNAFGDIMSYIRLMAVGLASYYIASAFNGLAGGVADAVPVVGIVLAILILIAAHALNIALCLIAIFAHGVRLNMLEFSNNAGVQWAGFPFRPFRGLCRVRDGAAADNSVQA